jgi:hypothetical protein
MPNLWTTTTQRIYEAFYGPKNRDTEYDTKLGEIATVEKGMLHMKLIFRNFFVNTKGIKTLCKDIYTTIGFVYDEKCSYASIIKDTISIHHEIEALYDKLVKKFILTNKY